jgi:hypothetical protein
MSTTPFTKQFVTVSQAAQLIGVSRQRMHQLIFAYDLHAEVVGSGRVKVLHRKELRKIPSERPPGPKSGRRI